jgi:prevent-host-death family protein
LCLGAIGLLAGRRLKSTLQPSHNLLKSVDKSYHELVPATFNVHEARTHFSKILARVGAGEEIVIAKAGKPIARLMPIRPEVAKKRTPGIDKGKIWMSKDFDVMTDQELKLWYESS